jgi:hypothetical protein
MKLRSEYAKIGKGKRLENQKEIEKSVVINVENKGIHMGSKMTFMFWFKMRTLAFNA